MFPSVPGAQTHRTVKMHRTVFAPTDSRTQHEIAMLRRAAWRDLNEQVRSKNLETRHTHQVADLTLKLHARSNNAKEMAKQCARLNVLLGAITDRAEEEDELAALEEAIDAQTTYRNEDEGATTTTNEGTVTYVPGSQAEMEAHEDEAFAMIAADKLSEGEVSSQDSADYGMRAPPLHPALLAATKLDAVFDALVKDLAKIRRSIGIVVGVVKSKSLGEKQRAHRGVRHCRRMRYYRTHMASLIEAARKGVKGISDAQAQGKTSESTTQVLKKKIADLENQLDRLRNPTKDYSMGIGQRINLTITDGMSKDEYATLDKLSWKLEQLLEKGSYFAIATIPGVDEKGLLRIIQEQRTILAGKS